MPRNPSNLHDRDYRAEARRFACLPHPIIDVHAHVNGARASHLLREAMDLYGVRDIWSMTALEQVPAVREALGDRLRLIAVPDFASKDRQHAHGPGFLERIEGYHRAGARICKFWAAPRITDFAIELGDPGMFRLDAPTRLEAMQLAEVHDCFTVSQALAIEALGFAAPGEAAAFIEASDSPGFRGPVVNASGGLVGVGHPVGATGVRMLLDVARQVRGRAGAQQVPGARAGITSNLGGSGATAVSFVVVREEP